MPDSEPTEPIGVTLSAVLVEAVSLVKASDAFRWLTSDAAEQLDARATSRRSVMNQYCPLIQAQISDPRERDALDTALRVAKAEIHAQQMLAQWLRRLGSNAGEGGDV